MSHRAFRPRLWPSLLMLATVAACGALGTWQLERAQTREAMQRSMDDRTRTAPVPLPDRVVDADGLRYRNVTARGYYEVERQFLLDNRVWHGRAGYHVVTPLRLAHSEVRVLVNRGWIATGSDRTQLPAFSTPAGAVEVSGIAVVPRPWTFSLGKPDTDWQAVWPRLDLERFAILTGWPLQPVVIQLSPESAPPDDGLARDWPRADAAAGRNRGYAAQWFSFAATALGLWLWHSLRELK